MKKLALLFLSLWMSSAFAFQLPDSLDIERGFGPGRLGFDRSALKGQLERETWFWSQYNRILFLGEGSDSFWDTSVWGVPFARLLHQVYPNIELTKTDLD